MTIAAHEVFLAENPHIETFPNGAPLIHTGRGLSKPADSFRDVLREMKKAHTAGGKADVKSTINTW